MESNKGREIHSRALAAQEKGDLLMALQLEDEAMIVYQRDNDALGFSEIQAMRFLTLRHLYDQTGYRGYLLLAKHYAQVGVEIATESGSEDDKALPMGTLAKTHELLGDYKGAVETYSKVVDLLQRHPDFRHSRKSVIADFKVDLYTAAYQSGDKGALEMSLSALKELEQSTDASEIEMKTWLSGGYMRIASMLKNDNLDLSRKYLEAARATIDGDDRLRLRRSQWEKLNKEING